MGFGIARSCRGFASHSPEVVFPNEKIVEAAFEYFRQTGFPYRRLSKHECMQEINKLARSGNDELLHTVVGYSVADTYHPHRFHGKYEGRTSPKDAFDVDDDWVRMCLRKTLEYDGAIRNNTIPGFHRSHVAVVKVCSNFRPGFALLQYRRQCKKGAVVLDTSTGYGGRLVGWLASDCGRYIGIDPNTEVYQGNTNMASDFGRSDDVELFCCPAEDLEHRKVEGRCDFAFTSPPYFCAEVYSDQDTQSCNRYQDAKQWRDGFLLPMMRLQFAALKTGCLSCVNIADVKIKGQVIPLVRWCVRAGEKVGFAYEGSDLYKLRRHFGSGGQDNKEKARTESILRFRKP